MRRLNPDEVSILVLDSAFCGQRVGTDGVPARQLNPGPQVAAKPKGRSPLPAADTSPLRSCWTSNVPKRLEPKGPGYAQPQYRSNVFHCRSSLLLPSWQALQTNDEGASRQNGACENQSCFQR